MNFLGGFIAGLLAGNDKTRNMINQSLNPIIDGAINSIKPMIQNTIDNLNGKENNTNDTNDISEQSEE